MTRIINRRRARFIELQDSFYTTTTMYINASPKYGSVWIGCPYPITCLPSWMQGSRLEVVKAWHVAIWGGCTVSTPISDRPIVNKRSAYTDLVHGVYKLAIFTSNSAIHYAAGGYVYEPLPYWMKASLGWRNTFSQVEPYTKNTAIHRLQAPLSPWNTPAVKPPSNRIWEPYRAF